MDELSTRLDRIESMLRFIMEREQKRQWYSVEEFARHVGRAPFTVREYCRLGRVNATKKLSGRGEVPEWAIAHEEMERYEREGLLPTQRRAG